MGPINILQMGYREFTTRWSDIRLSVFLLIAAIMVEGIALDLFGIDAQIASNILLLFLSIRIFRTLMGEDPNSAPFFPYVGNSMLIGLLCGLLVIPLVIAVVIIGFGIWADGFETLGFWMLALIVLADNFIHEQPLGIRNTLRAERKIVCILTSCISVPVHLHIHSISASRPIMFFENFGKFL